MMPTPVLAVLAALSAAAAPPPMSPPPRPDFQRPVDYRAWYEEQVAPGRAANALDMYGVFLYAPKDDPLRELVPVANSKVGRQLRSFMLHPHPWTVSDNPEFAEWCGTIEARLAAPFEAGTKRPYYVARPVAENKLLAEFKSARLDLARCIGQFVFARAWVIKSSIIYTDSLLEALRQNLHFAGHLAQAFTVEEQLFASGHRLFSYNQMRAMLRSRTTDLEMCRDMRLVLDEVDATPMSAYLTRALYFYEASAFELLQHLCTAFGPAGPQLGPTFQDATIKAYFQSRYGDTKLWPRGWEKLAAADPVDLAEAIHGYFEGMRGLFTPNEEAMTARIAALHAEHLTPRPALEALTTPVDLLVPSIMETEANRRMSRLLLEMATMYKDTGQWPVSMDAMSFPRLAECRIDPFTGRDFRIVPIEKHAAIYSVGPDGKDDGGDPTHDIVMYTVVPLDVDLASQQSPGPGAAPAPPAGGSGAPAAESMVIGEDGGTNGVPAASPPPPS